MMNERFELNEAKMEQVNGGLFGYQKPKEAEITIEKPSDLRKHPMYNKFKEYYKQAGMGAALEFCHCYLSMAESLDMVKAIGEDIARG